MEFEGGGERTHPCRARIERNCCFCIWPASTAYGLACVDWALEEPPLASRLRRCEPWTCLAGVLRPVEARPLVAGDGSGASSRAARGIADRGCGCPLAPVDRRGVGGRPPMSSASSPGPDASTSAAPERPKASDASSSLESASNKAVRALPTRRFGLPLELVSGAGSDTSAAAAFFAVGTDLRADRPIDADPAAVCRCCCCCCLALFGDELREPGLTERKCSCRRV